MDIKFRETNNSKDILGLMKNAPVTKSILWQTVDGKRVVYAFEDLVIFEPLRTFDITLKNYNDDLLISEIIYIKLGRSETLFKASVINIDHNKLSIFIPETVKTIEFRETPRVKFRPRDEKYLILQIESELMLSANQNLKLKVTDISEAGVCVLVGDNNISILENALMVSLVELGTLELLVPIRMSLRYTQRIRFRSEGKEVVTNRVGFKFEGEISRSDLVYFTRKY